MSKENPFDGEALLQELSNSVSSAVAEAYIEHVRAKERYEAEELIKDRISPKKAKQLTKYLIDKASRPVEMVETSIGDIEKKESDEIYLVRYGDKIVQSSLYERTPEVFYFFLDKGIIPMEKIDQIWRIIPKNF